MPIFIISNVLFLILCNFQLFKAMLQ